MAVQLNGHMKRILIFAIGILLSVSFKSLAAQPAQARLFCLSLRFQQGTDSMGFYTMDLTTIASGFNGELAPSFSSPDHYTFFRQYDTLFEETVQEGEMDFNTPAFTDANNDGFDDYFDVSRAVSGKVSTGVFASPVDDGTVRATWSRPAGSKVGTCVLRLTGNTFGQLPDFTHAFELIEYTGPLSFTPGTNRVTGTLNLTQTGDPANQLVGPVEFVKSPADRFNKLALQPGVLTLTNFVAQTLTNLDDPFQRDPIWPTNYFGYVDFEDGDPNTPDDPDYLTWFLSIDDTNDSDGDGIPDFSDDVASTSASAPLLILSPGSTNLMLNVTGTVGRTHEVQRNFLLDQTNWATVLSFSLTNSPQSVVLPLPTNAASFWRVRAL